MPLTIEITRFHTGEIVFITYLLYLKGKKYYLYCIRYITVKYLENKLPLQPLKVNVLHSFDIGS